VFFWSLVSNRSDAGFIVPPSELNAKPRVNTNPSKVFEPPLVRQTRWVSWPSRMLGGSPVFGSLTPRIVMLRLMIEMVSGRR